MILSSLMSSDWPVTPAKERGLERLRSAPRPPMCTHGASSASAGGDSYDESTGAGEETTAPRSQPRMCHVPSLDLVQKVAPSGLYQRLGAHALGRIRHHKEIKQTLVEEDGSRRSKQRIRRTDLLDSRHTTEQRTGMGGQEDNRPPSTH